MGFWSGVLTAAVVAVGFFLGMLCGVILMLNDVRKMSPEKRAHWMRMLE